MVWNPFDDTNINLDLIWHNKMALTNLSTTMIAKHAMEHRFTPQML